MIEDGSVSEAGATGNIDGINAEALMDQIEAGQPVEAQTATQSAPTGQPAQTADPTAQPAAATQTQPPTQAAAPWEKDTIKINGQEFQATRAQILQWAAQGRNYPQLVEKLNAEKAQYESQYKTYAEIDQFAKANPDWWNTVVQSYQNKGSQTPASAAAALPPEVQSKLNELSEFKSSFETQQAQKALDADVQDIRKQYPDLSWDVLDEAGSSLEMRVYDHAIKNGIQSFKTAFRDLMHDHLIKYSSDKAKEQAVKEHQAQRRTGLVGVSSTSNQAAPSAPKKFKNYDDASAAALAELGIQAG